MTVNDLFKAPDPSGIFEMVELLGEGSYGSVYKGRHIRTGEMVAIKVVELIQDELEEIKLEVDILRLCKHPNVVNYFGTYLRFDKLWVWELSPFSPLSLSLWSFLREGFLKKKSFGSNLKSSFLCSVGSFRCCCC